MLSLVHILYGVQRKAMRQMPTIPTHWQDVGIHDIVSDSREASPGTLFVAIAGERTDGHRYLADVAARGAQAALVNRETVLADWPLAESGRAWVLVDPATGDGLLQATTDSFLLIAVDNPEMALQRLASYHRRQLAVTLVGITGSVGKTSTKEVVAAVLSQRFRTLKNKRSFNSDVTVPISLLHLTQDHELMVQELGMWAPGEIRFLCSLALPKIGIVTNVGASHLERMGSIEAIANTKAELIESLPVDGIAILNGDDEWVRGMQAHTRARSFFYGLQPRNDLWADQVQSFGLNGIAFQVHYRDEVEAFRVRLIGPHHVYSCLAAIATALQLGMSWDEIRQGLSSDEIETRIVTLVGPNSSTLIDDSYNAAPISTVAALDLLATLEGRKIAILGDMLELGSLEEEGHRQVGRRIPSAADELFVVGKRARWAAEEALAQGMPAERIHIAQTNAEIVTMVKPFLQPEDKVLIKGSRGAALEEVVSALRHRSEEAE